MMTVMNKSRSNHLLSPFDLHGLALRNRVVMAPLIASGHADLIAFGRPYLSNPDLMERFANGWELNPPADVKVWSAPTGQGYTDFPFHPSTSRT